MPKLTNNEIAKLNSVEDVKNTSLPSNACSVFMFDIQETIKDLQDDMENRNGKDFKIAKTSSNNYEIIDPNFEYNNGGTAFLTIDEGKMRIETALSGYKYSIMEKPI